MRRSILITSAVSSGYLPETIACLGAKVAGGGSFTTPQEVGLDRWFRDVLGYANGSYPTANVYSKIICCYINLNGISGADRVNVVNPGVFNFTDTGSPTYSAVNLDVTYNGSSNFSDTGFTPNGAITLAGSDFTGFGFHRSDTTSGGSVGGQLGELGGGNSYVNFNGTFKTILEGTITAYNQVDANVYNGLWMTYWTNSTTLKTMYNGVVIKTVSSSFNNTPTRSLYQGAVHSSSTIYGNACAFDFHIEVKSTWSDSDGLLIYNATKALEAVFGKTWL